MKINHDHIYTAGDIQRYLGGQMTAPEMNAFERATLDDPFLAEAVEGYETAQDQNWQPRLNQLRKHFAATENENDSKVIAFNKSKNNWWKYAAAILILVGGVTTYFVLNKTSSTAIDQPPVIAKAEDKITPVITNSAPVIPDSITANVDKTSQQWATKNLKKSDSTTIAFQKPHPVMADPRSTTFTNAISDQTSEAIITQPDRRSLKLDYRGADKTKDKDVLKNIAASSPITMSDTFKNNVAKTSNFFANVQPRGPFLNQQNISTNNGLTSNNAVDKFAANAGRKKEQEANKTFLAQVVGPDNNPLPFANINITNQGFGTYADVKGNVRLVSTDSIIPIEVKSLGYATQYINLKSNNANKIVLTESKFAADDKLDNVIAAKPSRIYKKYNPVFDSTANAEPADGWDKYNTYVLNNIEIPDEVLNRNIHGEVEISFDVQRNGAITNIKVDKSLCNDCDEIAKRLVEQGPQWKLKKGRKGKAKVKVQF